MTALMDQLRLEILATTSGNAITNHSGQSGSTAGWVVPFDGGTLTAASGLPFGYNGKALRLDMGNPSVGQSKLRSQQVAVVGLQWVNAVIDINAPGLTGTQRQEIRLGIEWFNASDVQIYTGQAQAGFPVLSPTNAAAQIRLEDLLYNGAPIQRQAPSGAAYGRITVQVDAYTTDATPYPNPLTYLSRLMVVVGANQSSVAGVVFSDVPETWQDLLPKALSARTLRGGDVDGVTDKLDAGMMVATVKDPLFTPENNARVRPGRPVRLMALNGATWEPIFRGKIVQATTSYAGDIPVVTITATDAMATLENYQQPLGKSGRFKQRVDSALLNVPITYTVVDTDVNVAQATISADESGTPLTQLTAVRDSLRGLFYVARDNVLKCFANNSYPSQTPTVTFSDDELNEPGTLGYTSIDTNFDSKNMVNTLTVTKTALSEKDGSKVYGPYINQASVNAWDSVSADLKVNDGDPATLAAAYLAAYDEPSIFCDSLTFDATDNVATAIVRELYEAARVKFSKAPLDAVYRVVSIEHVITATKWTVTLKFKPLESTSTIVVTNPPGGPNTGPKDLVPFTREVQTDVKDISFGGSSTAVATVNFPKQYESTPSVLAVGYNGLTSPRMIVQVDSASPTQAVIRIMTADGATHAGTRRIRWEAKPAT